MTEAEQGIKIIEAGITMRECLLIVFGWALGIVGSVFYYWYERFRKRRDFKNGLKSELEGNLERMVMYVSMMKLNLGKLDQENLKWTHNSLLKIHSQKEIDKLYPCMKGLLNLTTEKLKNASNTNAMFQTGKETALGKFNLVFLKNHLDKILLLDIDAQKLLYNIQFRIDVTNQAVDRYFYYFDKTYEPGTSEENRKKLDENITAIYEATSKNMYIVANDFIALIEKL